MISTSGFIFNAEVLEEQYKKEMEARKIDEEKDTNPRVRIVTTRGDLVIELYLDQAPSAVSNFIGLVEEQFLRQFGFQSGRTGSAGINWRYKRQWNRQHRQVLDRRMQS